MNSDSYFAMKKAKGLILTKRNLDPNASDESMLNNHTPVTAPEGLSYWDRKLCRYRSYYEQQLAIKQNDTPKELPLAASKKTRRTVKKSSLKPAAA